jgi:DNA-binding MarR family transcriptional regulator
MATEFFNNVGKASIGSRLRLLQEKINEDAANIYKLFGIDIQPKWFPVLHTLQEGSFTITEIAQYIGHSHPSVSKIVSEMAKKGLVKESKDASDGRRNVLSLSEKGQHIQAKMKYQLEDVENAVDGILNHTRHNLWQAIEEWEFMLEQKSLFKRVQDEKKLRESHNVSIVPFEDKYSEAFRALTWSGLVLTSGWKIKTISHWIILKNTFWIKAEKFWLRFMMANLWVFARL